MNEDLKVCGIYGIFDTLTGEYLYVGQSKNIYERKMSNFRRLRGERHLKPFTEWFVSIGKDESRLDLRVLCRCLDNDDIKNKLEIFWFNELHPRFYGAIPSVNNRWSHSEETRKRLLEEHVSLRDLGNIIRVQCTTIHVKCATSFFFSQKRSLESASSVQSHALTLTTSTSKWTPLITTRSKTCTSLVSLR